MNLFDGEKFIKELYQEFDVIDQNLKSFHDDLCRDVFALIKKSFSDIRLTEELRSAIKDKITEVFFSTQSVIDKDNTYAEYRINEELDRMRSLIEKRERESMNPEFDAKLLYFVKYHIVEHFSAVYNLSSEGFLLLDLYVKYHFQDLRQFNNNL
ncbi:hypothetical protein ACE1ET_19905 [Saccharicrinis sp. FJH62]|uniref:hypothetical protein n=1 Tax=Saccharicrinis sp. FJH62 TaxID=3344657 RepID=UPI0035D499AB